MQKRLVMVFLFAALLLLGGCFERSLTFQVRFDDIAGLKQEGAVYFEQSKIGRIEKITYTKNGDYLLDLAIEPEFKNAATEESKFFIASAPGDTTINAVIVEQSRPGGTVLQNGVIVQGSVRSGYFEKIVSGIKRHADAAEGELRRSIEQLQQSLEEASRQLDHDLGKTLENLSDQLSTFSAEVKKVPDSREMKQLEESVNQFAEEFKRAQKDVRDHIVNEVIPQLRLQLDRLRMQLQQEGREKEIEVIDRQVKEMTMA